MSQHHADKIRLLRAKLTALRERDSKYALAGACWHRYESIPVELDDVRAAEARIGYCLPEQYRHWLIEVGYGAGPEWGLLPLVAERPLQIPTGRGTTLYKQPMIFDLSAGERLHTNGEFADVSELSPEDCADRIKRDDRFVTARSSKGLLAICEADYGSFDAIVAVGPMRGAVVLWLYDMSTMGYRQDRSGFFFDSFDFFTWMETRIDRSLSQLEKQGE
jgi:hypothetical protein